MAEEVRAEPREETVHVVTQGIPDHTGSKDPPVHPVRKENWESRFQGFSRGEGRTWRINFNTNSCNLAQGVNCQRKPKCRIPVFCDRKPVTDNHVVTF